MARPLGIEFPGAVYHVTSRGDWREEIFVNDDDRDALPWIFALALSRFNAQASAYSDGQPLPLRAAHSAGKPVLVDASHQRGLHPELQPPAPQGGAPVPGPIQGDPGSSRRLSAELCR